jgi:hypothetical protein
MVSRAKIPPDIVADVVVSSRRRCCICFALSGDSAEKKGQVAHLDHDPANNAVENLAFLCLEHHDQYDSRTSQSKGLTVDEVRRYRGQLETFVAQSLPPSDLDIARGLLAALDRPAFRTPFHKESSLPKFRTAIAETIEAINTGKTPGREQLPSKNQVRDPTIRAKLDAIVEKLVALRASFDDLVRAREIRHCGCQDPDCPTYVLTDLAAHEMDRRRHELLMLAQELDPALPSRFYEML